MPQLGPQLYPLIVLLPLIAFWLWMFRHMIRNGSLPPGIKDMWTYAFIFLNVFAAAYYYITHYRSRH